MPAAFLWREIPFTHEFEVTKKITNYELRITRNGPMLSLFRYFAISLLRYFFLDQVMNLGRYLLGIQI